MSKVKDDMPQPVLRDTITISGRRATIARRMHESLQTMAQLTLHSRAAVQMPTSADSLSPAGHRGVGHTALVLYRASQVLPRHAMLNATLDGDVLQLWESINIGVAVATDWGLAVPVIHEAQRLSLAEISSAIPVIADNARASRLRAKDVLGGTFTVTNLGGHRVEWFTPIVNPPQVAILGVGRLDHDGRLPLSLSFDHRAIDGEPAAAFLDDLLAALEDPRLTTESMAP